MRHEKVTDSDRYLAISSNKNKKEKSKRNESERLKRIESEKDRPKSLSSSIIHANIRKMH